MRKIALLIGVSEYGEGISALSAPLNDVEAMKRVLKNPEMGGFEVQTLINPEAIKMRKAIQEFCAKCLKDDLILLFFSGHGITDDNNKLYLATRETNEKDFESTGVDAAFIHNQLNKSYAKRQVIILDCCYSGAFADGWQTKSVGIDLKKELGAVGRVVLTSSSKSQISFQHQNSLLSVYTQYLVEGIETGGADKDGDGKIQIRELHDYAKTKVQEVRPTMEPKIIIDREGFDIVISKASINDPNNLLLRKDKTENPKFSQPTQKMLFNDSEIKYLVNEISSYYGSDEQTLIAIFSLNQETFGKNLYGNIMGNSFKTRIAFLVLELIKRNKVKDFIEIAREDFSDFANQL